jgi:hypothetical protein
MENIIIIKVVGSSDKVGFNDLINELCLLLSVLLDVYLVAESYVVMLIDV